MKPRLCPVVPFVTLLFASVNIALAQFVLPDTPPREAQKPVIKPELESYFSINPASDFVQSFLNGVVPQPNYELSHHKQTVPNIPGFPAGPVASVPGLSIQRVQSSLPQSSAANFGGSSPPGSFSFGPLESLLGNNGNGADALSSVSAPQKRNSSSSTSGIPDIFPNLPKAPLPASSSAPSIIQRHPSHKSTVDASQTIKPTPSAALAGGLSQILSSLSGGGNAQQQLAGLSNLSPSAIQSLLSGSASPINGPPNPLLVKQSAPPNPFQLSGPSSNVLGSDNSISLPTAGIVQQDENPLSVIMRSLGLNNLSPNFDIANLNQVFGGLGGAQNGVGQPQSSASPLAGNNGVLSSVLYNALTDNSIQSTNSSADQRTPPKSPFAGNAVGDRSNAAVLQNLLSQPSSPLCSPKPQAVKKFQLDAFMGKWFQVLYSPPMSLGPCSMITYSKLSDIGNGGPGTVFNLFEYTTEGTPHGSPRISSGYAIVRDTGEMIYRTSSNPTDLNVYVLQTGPVNLQGQYSYVVLGINCNYPIYVLARDPMEYKQKFEQKVNSDLDAKGLATSWSRLLNVVSPVDYNLCNFPPTLFNVQG